jgi:hypothetical protein
MVKKKDVETEGTSPVPDEVAEDKSVEVVAETPQPTLEDAILKIYNDAPHGKKWALEELMEVTGATAFGVSAAWHSLFDQKLVAGTSFVKP